MTLRLSRAEAEALLRALDLVRIHALSRNRRDRPGNPPPEEAVEAKLLQALRAVRR